VTERAGRIMVMRDGRKLGQPFLDIRGRVQTGGESGLLSMAFAPDYASSRLFYVYYVDNDGAIVVEEYRRSSRNADRARAGYRRVVVRQRHSNFNHKGGQLQFGPDRRLYIGFGDGGVGASRNAQRTGTLLGKMLRVNPRRSGPGYLVPRSNPFVGRGGHRPEVYAVGLRNPYRFSFDRRRGHLTIGDVGESAIEEVDFVRNRRGRGRAPRGGYNFGWPIFEGRRRLQSSRLGSHRRPVLQLRHGNGVCGVIGGYVMRDRALGRRLYGRYIYSDICDPRLRVARLGSRRATGRRFLGRRVRGIVSFGEDARGRVYAVSLRGLVYRIARR